MKRPTRLEPATAMVMSLSSLITLAPSSRKCGAAVEFSTSSCGGVKLSAYPLCETIQKNNCAIRVVRCGKTWFKEKTISNRKTGRRRMGGKDRAG